MISELISKITMAAFATVGLIEFLKNFLKTEKKWIYSIIMPFVAIGCYLAAEYLPIGIIGGLLTIGSVQIGYQVIIQGFQKIIKNKTNTNEPDGEFK